MIRDEPGLRPARLLFIDNLRWSAITMVVVIHAAVTYSGLGRWYVRDAAATGFAGRVAFGTYQSFQHAVAMGLLFGIAGFFAGASLGRKGAAGFLRERAVRLGLPLLLYALVIGPITEYWLVIRHPTSARFPVFWLHHIGSGAIVGDSGPLWFCFVLLVFCAALAAYRRFRPQGLTPPTLPGPAAILTFAAGMAAFTFAVGLLTPAGTVLLNLDLHDLPQYPLMFAAGVAAQHGSWPRHISSCAGRAWGLAGVVVGLSSWVGLIGLGGALDGKLAPYGGGWHWQAAGMDLWRSFTCVALTLALITLYRDRFDYQGVASRFLTRNAFGVYVFHPPILIAITLALHDWPTSVAAKFILASLVAVTSTFLFVGLVARRVPGLRAVV